MNNPFQKIQGVFSVITPIYGDSWRTFSKFFSALNQQDYTYFEVVVVFDGENKKGVKELAKHTALYPKMKVRSLIIPHGGAPAARNAGAKVAIGDYFTFLDPDVYPLSETFRQWANAFESYPEKDVIWGLYSFIREDKAYSLPDSIPKSADGIPDYWAFRFMNYCSGMFPMRKASFVGWDETVKSLQDWDMWQRMLLLDNFKGEKFHYIAKSFCLTEPVAEGGISWDSHTHWKERVSYIREKNGIPRSPICVTSLGAPFVGLHVAKKLGADYLPMPSFKEHDYKAIYLLGFYPGPGGPTKTHLAVFAEPGHVRNDEKGLPDVQAYFKGKKIIHFIGTDILKLRTEVPFVTLKYLRDLWKENEFTLLSEFEMAQEELKELAIDTKIVPIPPDKLFNPLPLPTQFTVGIYENGTQNMYHEPLMEAVVRSMPDVQFYFFGDNTKKGNKGDNYEHLGWINLDEWMPKFSCNLRMTIHDGLPLTPLQFLTAGRSVVCNTELHGAVYALPERKAVIEALRSAQDSPIDPKSASYWAKKLDFATYTKTITALCN